MVELPNKKGMRAFVSTLDYVIEPVVCGYHHCTRARNISLSLCGVQFNDPFAIAVYKGTPTRLGLSVLITIIRPHGNNSK